MSRIARCDFEELERTVTSQFRCGARSIHGPTHWRRVERNGIWLAQRLDASVMVVRLFAWFHDSQRINESTDPGHGRRGAEFAASLRGKVYDLPEVDYERLLYACTWHTDQHHSDDTTVGACWDADRLDLGRVGIIPSPGFMNSEVAKQVAGGLERRGTLSPDAGWE